jgi:L-alanine-DL-glutamate epimerase-like enolase superfamily enzyme
MDTPIRAVEVSAYRIPTVRPESDGTANWTATTLVLVEMEAGGKRGIGYTYAAAATARLVADVLAGEARGKDALDIPSLWPAMESALRNDGRGGISAMAISAVDNAAWDLKAKLLDLPLAKLLGQCRASVPAYGSGGFTSLSIDDLREQLLGWVRAGFSSVKMKVGREPERDVERVRAARDAIGRAALFVDANGAYLRKRALDLAGQFAELGVSWFEEPVIRTDVAGLRLLRDRAPSSMEIAGGEYGYALSDYRTFLDAEALDVVQADITRCGGVTGFLRVSALCAAHDLPLSSHCSPALHVPLGCALTNVRHLESFFDHERIEHMLFDGAPVAVNGELRPDPSAPGFGLVFKRRDAEAFRVA